MEQELKIQHIEKIVEIDERGMFTTSLIVANVFEKEHKNVLRDIENLECSSMFNELNFEPVEYKDAKGEMRPAYRMTRDGFAFLAMGFTGKKAAAWKETFLEAFNALEEKDSGKTREDVVKDLEKDCRNRTPLRRAGLCLPDEKRPGILYPA